MTLYFQGAPGDIGTTGASGPPGSVVSFSLIFICKLLVDVLFRVTLEAMVKMELMVYQENQLVMLPNIRSIYLVCRDLKDLKVLMDLEEILDQLDLLDHLVLQDKKVPEVRKEL